MSQGTATIKPGPLWLATAPRAQLPACMGGFCIQRDHCGQHVTDRRAFVVERLCMTGQEAPFPVNLTAEELAA